MTVILLYFQLYASFSIQFVRINFLLDDLSIHDVCSPDQPTVGQSPQGCGSSLLRVRILLADSDSVKMSVLFGKERRKIISTIKSEASMVASPPPVQNQI